MDEHKIMTVLIIEILEFLKGKAKENPEIKIEHLLTAVTYTLCELWGESNYPLPQVLGAVIDCYDETIMKQKMRRRK